MKYEVEINSQKANLEIEERDGRLAASVDERSYAIEVVRPEQGVYLFFIGEKVYEARVSALQDRNLRVNLRGKIYNTRIIDRKTRQHSEDHSDTSQKQLTAPMPG